MKKSVAILLGLDFLVGAKLGLAADAACKNQSETVVIQDVGDGDHVAARIPTDRGALEPHVRIKNGGIAGMTFYLNGKPMTDKTIPKAARSCIKSTFSSDNQHSSKLFDWLSPLLRRSNLSAHSPSTRPISIANGE
ncbi:MAG: hypothetical protein ACJ8AW_51335 [Rhodopila sp.]